MPLISVIVPVYNVETYIDRCVKSLCDQNYKDCEILLVDDGSTDHSGDVCDQLASRYPNVISLHKKNGGLGSARNFGMEHAEGKYLVFVDSDDWVTNHYFAFLDEHLQNSQVDMLKYGYQRVNVGKLGSIAVPYYAPGYYNRSQIEKDILPGAIGPIRLFDYTNGPVLSACVCAYSRDFLQKNRLRFYSERTYLNEDFLFNFEALLCAEDVEITHEVLYFYDFREGSLSKHYRSNMLQRKIVLLEKYKELLEHYGFWEQYEIPYYNQCVDSFYACITNECGPWADDKTATDQVAEILNNDLCRHALAQCNTGNMGLKGRSIWVLMRLKQSRLISIMYRIITR